MQQQIQQTATGQMEQTKFLTEIYGIEDAELLEQSATDSMGPSRNELWLVLNRMTNLENEIKKIWEIAGADTQPLVYKLAHLHRVWDGHLQMLSRELGEGQRTIKMGSAGQLRFEDKCADAKTFVKILDGKHAIYVDNRDALLSHFKTLDASELAAYGAEPTVAFDSEKVLKALAASGEMLPGVNIGDVIPNGKFRSGDTKPFSAIGIMKKLRKILTGLGGSLEDETATAD